ncbi:MAG: protein RarD [Ponticaulis sp.]|nr:protein RarD [Ponticaulis sp.]|tara:strand:- start:13062 stop:13958 length:897 start_codon:yes stop_codon:yes gene_type:complete
MKPDIQMGLMSGLGAYLIWGFLPVFFKFVQHIASVDILAHRVFWSLPMGLLLIVLAGRWTECLRFVRSKDALWMMLSAVFIACNWLVYIWAIGEARVMEASLGYFLNPLINVAVASIFLSERLRIVQWTAVAIAAVAVAVETLALGRLPWVSLVLGFSFCAYGLIRRRVQTDSRIGFTLEVLFLMPLVLFWFGYSASSGRNAWGDGMGDFFLLVMAGPVTAIPLMLFALAAKRLRFSTVGIMQYIAPSLQFMIALAYGEELTPLRAVTFSLIALALIIFSVDAFGNERRMRRASLRPT